MNMKPLLFTSVFLCFIGSIGCQGIGSGDDPADETISDDLVTSLSVQITADSGGGPDIDYTVTLDFTGPTYSSWKYVYAAWIEDASVAEDEVGVDDEFPNNLQNLYICNAVLDRGPNLTGNGIPYWFTKMYSGDDSTVDSVTGASIQGSKTVTRDLDIGDETRFRVCFEIDRSKNPNQYFTDRPAFIYKTDVIDLNSLDASYDLDLVAYMPNGTVGNVSWTQSPRDGVTIPGFEAYAYLTSLSYIKDDD